MSWQLIDKIQINKLKELAMNKTELNYLLNEANILLDEIEVTIENMFADAINAQKF